MSVSWMEMHLLIMHADIFKNDDPASSTTTLLPAWMIWAMAVAAAVAETCASEPVSIHVLPNPLLSLVIRDVPVSSKAIILMQLCCVDTLSAK
ncbi:RNA recognition [Musa troglodytarum]|uniref:RNA recognition n=1 Tax=Musa troglodytarum TaxID=320322 RepID=A0A9E7GQZ3_9LILI|nr:RNA recognition [Musa troglodytarum]